jgi:phenylacetate-CoA ligase
VTLREFTGFSTELVAAYRRNDAPRQVIDTIQRRRVDELLRIARTTRRWHGLAQLDDAPVLTKHDVVEDFSAGMIAGGPSRLEVERFLAVGAPASLLRDRFIVTTTSGTTGELGLFVIDDLSFARLRATVFARIFRDQLTPEGFALLARRRYRITFVVATGGHTMTSVMALRMPKAGRLAADVSVVALDQGLERIIAALHASPPLLLHSYATFLEVLAHEALAGRLHIRPELITAGSEPLTVHARAALQRAFPSATILETWGATEHVGLAVSCRYGHLHINEDVAILEPVDRHDRAVVPGCWSERVLVTNLVNHTQPLLRYRLDDRVRIEQTPCPCGSPFRRVEVEGRTDDTIFFDDGTTMQAHTPIPLEFALLGTVGLRQFTIVHTMQNHLEVQVVADDDADDTVLTEVNRRLHAYLADHGLADRVQLHLQRVTAIARHPRSKKIRQITSQVQAPSTSVPAATLRGRDVSRRPR